MCVCGGPAYTGTGTESEYGAPRLWLASAHQHNPLIALSGAPALTLYFRVVFTPFISRNTRRVAERMAGQACAEKAIRLK